jgi:hypothetical protein
MWGFSYLIKFQWDEKPVPIPIFYKLVIGSPIGHPGKSFTEMWGFSRLWDLVIG